MPRGGEARDTFPWLFAKRREKGTERREENRIEHQRSRQKRLQLLVSPAGFTEPKETLYNGAGVVSSPADSAHYLLKIHSFYQRGIVSLLLSFTDNPPSCNARKTFTAWKRDRLQRTEYLYNPPLSRFFPLMDFAKDSAETQDRPIAILLSHETTYALINFTI